MNNHIIWIIVGIIGAIVIFSRVFTKAKDRRQQYLDAMAKYLDGAVTPLPDYEDSYEIKFTYKGANFAYTDIEDPGFHTPTYRGVLKAPTNDPFTMSFTENPKSKMRADISSISDVLNAWKDMDVVRLPKELQGFTVFTTNPSRSNALILDEQISKIFLKYKNVDSRGHPVMSLEILEGIVTLKFHPLGASLNPSIFDLQNNPTSISTHLDRMLPIVTKVNQMKAEETL